MSVCNLSKHVCVCVCVLEIFTDPRYEGQWIKFNVNQAGYYRVNYTPDMWKQLTELIDYYADVCQSMVMYNII